MLSHITSLHIPPFTSDYAETDAIEAKNLNCNTRGAGIHFCALDCPVYDRDHLCRHPVAALPLLEAVLAQLAVSFSLFQNGMAELGNLE